MPKNVYFYYDESGHSRKITSKTIDDKEFKYNFVSVIVGVSEDDVHSFEHSYESFENKWKELYSCLELKSSVVKRKRYEYGLASFKKNDIKLYAELFQIIAEYKLYLHVGVFNKIQYLVNQMLLKADLLKIINFNSVSYSMTKALCVYHPNDVLSSIENDIQSFIPKFKSFLKKRMNLNTRINGKSEDFAFAQMIGVLNSINENISLDWNYVFSFDGFKKYISELDLKYVSLLIDREGNGNTLCAAKKDLLKNASEEDSKNSYGIRCADMIAGFINNLIDSLELSVSYNENDQPRDDNLLSTKWFEIPEEVFNAYKLAYKVLIELNSSWYKFYCSNYSDGVIQMTSLLHHFNGYDSYDDYKKESTKLHAQKVNALVAIRLKDAIKDIEQSYGVDSLDLNDNKDFYYNQKGAKCYYDFTKHKMLTLPRNGDSLKYFVLSVGFFHDKINELNQPCITISENGNPVCYLLPMDFSKWVHQQMLLSISHNNQFPCFLIISRDKNDLNLMMSDE